MFYRLRVIIPGDRSCVFSLDGWCKTVASMVNTPTGGRIKKT